MTGATSYNQPYAARSSHGNRTHIVLGECPQAMCGARVRARIRTSVSAEVAVEMATACKTCVHQLQQWNAMHGDAR